MSNLSINEMSFKSLMEQMTKVLYGELPTDSASSTTSILTFPKDQLDEKATAQGYESSVSVIDWGYILATAPDPTISDSNEKRINSQLYAPSVAAVIELTHNIQVVTSKLMLEGKTLEKLTFSVLKRGGGENGQATLSVSNSVELQKANIKLLQSNERLNRILLTFSYEQVVITNYISDKNSIQQGMVKSSWNKVTGCTTASK